MRLSADTTFDHKDPYRILGVSPGIGPSEMRKAYLGLAKKYHPNLFATDPEKYRATTVLMQDINAAYELLSDPVQREYWDRKHLTTPKPVSRPESKSDLYDSGLVDTVIRRYNEFVQSLRTEAERHEASRRIKQFHESREGSAFITSLAARHYQKVMDLIRRGKRITMYDDGLVEIMFLFEGKIEVIASDIFITYAYLLHRRDGHEPQQGPNSGKPGRANPGGSRTRGPRARSGSRQTGIEAAKDLGARIWKWFNSPS